MAWIVRMGARWKASWKGDCLYWGSRESGFEVERDGQHATMWRARGQDGSLSEMLNRTRAKDLAMDLLERKLNAGRER